MYRLPEIFFPHVRPGIADLKEGKDGVWEFTTTAPLKPELYSYSFIVDGLKIMDPSNVYMIRDVATVTNVFIIGGGRADLYKVNDVPHGTVSRMWYNSPTLGTLSGVLSASWSRRR